MKFPFEAVGVLTVVLFSLSLTYFGLFEDASYLLPSYDNALLHSGRVRFVYDTGFWIPFELVFGGKTISYHVPAYASLVASFARISGLNWLWAIRFVALLFSILFPLGFYLLAKHLANWQAGVAAAFFALMSSSLMTWGTRTSAISLGVLLVVYLFYFLLTRQHVLLVIGAIVLALTHPPSLLVFFATSGLYAAFLALHQSRTISSIKKQLTSLPFVGAMVGFLAYMLWHIRVTGLSCLTFKCMPQLAAKEYGASVDLLAKATLFPYGAGFLGLSWLIFSNKAFEQKALVLAWFIVIILLVKNDLFGVGVFTERFVTFMEQALAVLAGLLVGLIFTRVEKS